MDEHRPIYAAYECQCVANERSIGDTVYNITNIDNGTLTVAPGGVTHADSAHGDLPGYASTGAAAMYVFGTLVWWYSQRVPGQPQSSTEAEYINMSQACKRISRIQFLLEDMGYTDAATKIAFYVDNQATVKMTEAPNFTRKSNHIHIRYHYTKHLAQQDRINIHWIATDQQIADVMTKPLAGPQFSKLIKFLVG